MDYHLKIFLEKLKNKTVAFVGLARTNLPLIKLLLRYKNENHIKIVVCDAKKEKTDSIIKELANEDIDFRLGKSYLENLKANIIFRSPGVDYNLKELVKARNQGIEVTSEIEEFFKIHPCKIIGITGSDGKTTTTKLIGNILENAGYKIYIGGNIGKPILNKIENIKPTDIAVLELSSFQLISVKNSPDIAVLTNISPNHLDIHKNMDEYVSAKKNILVNQKENSLAVLNVETFKKYNLKKCCKGETLLFTANNEKILNGTLEHNENICFIKDGVKKLIIKKEDIRLKGKHNIENCLAAICATYSLVPIDAITKTLKEFSGVEHRLEFVGTYNGVTYINDSIATTPTRTIKGALSLFKENVILIAGGYNKNIPFDELGEKILKTVKVLILMGDTAKNIDLAVKRCLLKNKVETTSSALKIFFVKNMHEAILRAKEYSVCKDTIILSPACASFGLYKNFEERGTDFKKLAKFYNE